MKPSAILPAGRAALCGLALWLAPRLAAAEPAPVKPDDLIALPKYQVKGEAVCPFGIGVGGLREPDTHRIKRLFITEVTVGSEAERLGLQAGDEILSLNGKKVAGMDGTKQAGSELFELLVNQAAGQTLALEVIVHSVKNLNLTALPLDEIRYRISPPGPEARRTVKAPEGTGEPAPKP